MLCQAERRKSRGQVYAGGGGACLLRRQVSTAFCGEEHVFQERQPPWIAKCSDTTTAAAVDTSIVKSVGDGHARPRKM